MKDPEDLGIQLAESIDTAALQEEAEQTSMAEEVRTSFFIQFEENQQHIQHELLEGALTDRLQSPQTSPETLTQDEVVGIAKEYACDAYREYASYLLDETVSYSEVPDASEFGFNPRVVEGFWDGAEDRIEQYFD